MCTAYYIPVMYAVISDKFASQKKIEHIIFVVCMKICLPPENLCTVYIFCVCIITASKKYVFEAWINLNEIFFFVHFLSFLNVQFII